MMQAKKWLAAALVAAALSVSAVESPAPAKALDRPAMVSAKASRLAMLAAVRVGKRVVAAGERGTVVFSDDGGSNWRQAQVPTSVSLTAMQFVDANLGWAVGHMGVVLHSADSGETWAKQLDGIRAARLVLDDAQERGDARAIADAERLVADGADKPFFDLCFIDDHTGFIVGAYNLIFRTDDGGRKWTPWQAHVGNSNPKGLHLYGVRAVGGALFIVGEQGLLLRSEDRGEHFTALTSPYAGSWFGLLADQDGVVVFGLRGNAYRSDDLGNSWRQLPTGTPVTISAGLRTADGRLLLATQAGQLLISGDRGASFAPLAGAAGLPLAAVTEAPDGLVLASLRGLRTVALPKP
jgi:photosystem II stability/assembly factor-like uncharacterized protein